MTSSSQWLPITGSPDLPILLCFRWSGRPSRRRQRPFGFPAECLQALSGCRPRCTRRLWQGAPLRLPSTALGVYSKPDSLCCRSPRFETTTISPAQRLAARLRIPPVLQCPVSCAADWFSRRLLHNCGGTEQILVLYFEYISNSFVIRLCPEYIERSSPIIIFFCYTCSSLHHM